MNKIKAYIIWIWKIIPKIKIVTKRKSHRMMLLKLCLKRDCNQSPKITPWPYKPPIPVKVPVKLSDIAVTPAEFGLTAIIGEKSITDCRIETYGFIKKPMWFQFWKMKDYRKKIEAEKQRMFEDFKPITKE